MHKVFYACLGKNTKSHCTRTCHMNLQFETEVITCYSFYPHRYCSENVWMTGLTVQSTKHKARQRAPETPEFEHMCMVELVSEYRIVYEQKNSKKVLPIQNEMGFIQKLTRRKLAVILYACISSQKHTKKYFGTLLKL